MISAVISGNVGTVERKTLPSGDAVLEISVASNKYDYKTKAKRAVWVRVSVFGKRAEGLGKVIEKGSSVACRGELDVREYMKKDGTPGHSIEMRADDVELVGSRQTNDARPAHASNGADTYEGPLPF